MHTEGVSNATTYRSKTDRWLGAAFVIAPICGALGMAVAASQLPSALPVILVLGFAILVLPVWTLARTAYVLDDRELLVASGPFKWRVPLKDITNIVPTRDPLSSPALSLDRLRIEYARGRTIMISPMDKDLFVSDLNGRRGALGISR